MIYALGTKVPDIAPHCFIAPDATVIGQVVIEQDVSLWFNTVLRGDNDTITIGAGSNVQEGSVIHVDPGAPVSIGRRVTIGHKAMIHGCAIGDGSLIGMNAVVLNHAVIGHHCLIGANALITEGMVVPDGAVVLGSPAKVIRAVSARQLQSMDAGVQSYIDKIDQYNAELRPLDS